MEQVTAVNGVPFGEWAKEVRVAQVELARRVLEHHIDMKNEPSSILPGKITYAREPMKTVIEAINHVTTWRFRALAAEAALKDIREKMAAEKGSSNGSHPYHGPVKDGKAIEDEVHERFHKAIGDVMDGKVIPDAQKQMKDALDKAPKPKPAFPVRAAGAHAVAVGLRTP